MSPHTSSTLDGRFEEVTLSRAQKEQLFSESIANRQATSEEADLILRNLRRCAPDLAPAVVKRTAGTLLETPFRIIKEIDHKPASPDPSYLCISYCWRNEDFDGKDLEPAPPLPFSQPFVDAILDQRASRDEGIWIDQLCIRQNDEEEKRQAIAMMDVIYRSCRRLIIILEDARLTPAEAAVLQKYDAGRLEFGVTWNPESSDVEDLATLCQKILATRWWTRAWCFHEFAVNEPWSAKRCNYEVHNAVFIIGMHEPRSAWCLPQPKPIGTTAAKWITIQSILVRMMNLYPQRVQRDSGAPGIAFLPILEDKTSPFNDAPVRTVGSEKSSILAKCHAVTSTNCSVAPDRLSVALNLSNLGLAVAREIQEDVVELIAVAISLAAGEKAALTFVNPLPIRIGNAESWYAPHHAGRSTTLRKFRLGSISGIHSVTVQQIELDMVFFNYPLAPQATDEDLAFTRKVFPHTIPLAEPALKDGYAMISVLQNHSAVELEPHRRQFLANCMRLGLEFISRLWHTLQRDVIFDNYDSGPFSAFAADNSLATNAEKLRGLSTDPSALNQEDAVFFLTWLADPRSMYHISALSHALLCTATAQGALFTSAIIREGFKDKQIRLAIPRDLVDSTCDAPRVWILSPVADSGYTDIAAGCPWHLVGKGLLLGEPDLLAEMERDVPMDQKGVFLGPRQIVRW